MKRALAARAPGRSLIGLPRTRQTQSRAVHVSLRSLGAEATDVRGLGDDLSFHRFQQFFTSCRRRQIEIRVQRVELEHVVVIARTGWRSRTKVRVLPGDASANYGARRHAAFGDAAG